MTVAGFHQLELPDLGTDLAVASARVQGGLHATWCAEVTVELAAADAAPDAESLLGAEARLTLGSFGPLRGDVTSVVLHDRASVTITIEPPVAALAHTKDHRVFVGRATLDLVEEVLADHGLTLDKRVDQPPPERMQCVQAFESDLAFVTRVLAEDGIVWLSAEPGSFDVTVTDIAGGFSPIDGDPQLPYGGSDGLNHPEAVTSARLRRQMRPDRVTLVDSWFETPSLDLTAEAGTRDGSREHYAFPGPNRYQDPDRGKALASRWLESMNVDGTLLEGVSTCPRLWPGRTFELVDAPRADLSRQWLVVSIESESHERSSSGERRYENRFTAVPADTGFRPAIPEAPHLGGVQTATVTGPPGEEIHTDAFGRVTAKLRWDRRGSDDDTSSAWVRPLHPQTSGGFMLPRVGWEVLLGFGGPSGDLPFVLGRLDNGAAPTAESLPGQMRRGNFGTPTTPGGGSANMFRMDDAAGSEEFSMVASNDYDEQTAQNKQTTVLGNAKLNVDGDQELTFEASRGIKVQSPQTISVGADREVTGLGGMGLTSGSQTVSVGGVRDVTVGGHLSNKIGGDLGRLVGGAKILLPIAGHNRHVDGASVVAIGGAWIANGAADSISVAGASALTCGSTKINAGKVTLHATAMTENGAARRETAGGVIALEASTVNMNYGATKLDAPLTLILAKDKVTINAGGATLEVTSGKVTLTGPFDGSGDIVDSGKAEVG